MKYYEIESLVYNFEMIIKQVDEYVKNLEISNQSYHEV